jgi:VanZ family protein
MSISVQARTVVTALAWVLAAALVVVTWGPQSIRPHVTDPQVERFAAYFLTAAVFVAAYPKRVMTIVVASAAFAVALELGQFLAPERDPGVPDAIAKSLGGVCGAMAAHLLLRVRRG